MAKVLVTGGSGFVGAHCILQLLAAGHEVSTTVRSLAREVDVRAMLAQAGAPEAKLGFFAADLMSDTGRAEAVAGCDYVLHVASPFPGGVPAHEDELIIPARDGALRVLRAARDAGVKRVVLTSSFAAIGYGAKPKNRPFTEEDWTDPDSGVQPYVKSKTIAERAAWDFIAREGGSLELSVVCPVGIFGPVLGPDYSTSILLVRRFVSGDVPGVPRLWFGCVDVRDVASLHLLAMTHPAAKGERFLCVAGDFLTSGEIAAALRNGLGPRGAKVPKRVLPDLMVRLVGMFDPNIKLLLPELGKPKNGSNAKARTLLGWNPRPPEEGLVATAESLFALGLV